MLLSAVIATSVPATPTKNHQGHKHQTDESSRDRNGKVVALLNRRNLHHTLSPLDPRKVPLQASTG
eukprot:m.362686 g.362686  ORF g.362686 m.362686 type:complete len:66 (+) comp16651_c1_seq2:2355-2552(+)